MKGHCLFITFLARTIQHSSIKVYLSGLELSTLNKGSLIRFWTAFVPNGLYVAPSTVMVLLLPTDFPLPLIWCWSFGILWIFTFWIIACSGQLVPYIVGYFGFLCASEFTLPNLPSFMSSLHLGVQDIGVDSPSAPSWMPITIKGSRTYPFRKGCFIHIGVKRHPLCAVHALMSYLALRGDGPGPPFVFQNGQPLLA